MQFALRQEQTGAEDAKAADLPQIHFFTVGQRAAYHPVDTVSGSWNVATPETAARVSAVAFYFARRVQQETHVPIGLMVEAVGGAPAETWTSIAAIQPLHDFDPLISELNHIAAKGTNPEYGNFVMPWYDEYDIGMKQHWAAPDYDDSSWKQVTIPGGFAELGVPDTPALVYFRKDSMFPTGRNMVQLGIMSRIRRQRCSMEPACLPAPSAQTIGS
jgi:sialate O-acetylesterase